MKAERYQPDTLILKFRKDWHPMLGVWHDYNDGIHEAGAQHGTYTTLYNDLPGARLWWFVEDYKDSFDKLLVMEE